MRIFREVLERLAGEADLSLALSYTVVHGCGGCFQNVKGIARFSQEEILLSLKAGEVRVRGKSLVIENYCEGDMWIRGEILSVEQLL